MAKVANNIFVRGLTGSLGDQFVVRKGRGGNTVISNKPTFSPNRTFTTVQLTHQDAFRMAIAYARTAKTQEVYKAQAEGTTHSAYNAAVKDWFNKPEVLEIDTEEWTGQIGETIKVKAQDDTYVSRVQVEIRDEGGALLEAGDAARADGLWWEYTTKSVTPRNPMMVIAEAHDLPGNTGSLSVEI